MMSLTNSMKTRPRHVHLQIQVNYKSILKKADAWWWWLNICTCSLEAALSNGRVGNGCQGTMGLHVQFVLLVWAVCLVFSVTQGMFSTNPGIAQASLRLNIGVFHHYDLHNGDNFDPNQRKVQGVLSFLSLPFSTNTSDALAISTSSQRREGGWLGSLSIGVSHRRGNSNGLSSLYYKVEMLARQLGVSLSLSLSLWFKTDLRKWLKNGWHCWWSPTQLV